MAFLSKTIKISELRPAAAGLLGQLSLILVGLLSTSVAFSAGASAAGSADMATIKQVKISKQKGQATLSLTLDKPVKYKVFTLSSPDRVVIDLQKTQGGLTLTGPKPVFLRKLRHASRNGNDLRIVLDLKKAVTPRAKLKNRVLKVALLASSGKDSGSKQKNPKKPLKKVIKAGNSKAKPGHKPEQKKRNKRKKPMFSPAPTQPGRLYRGDFIVAVDAGHGGRDPGAIGANGTREKDIALQIARKLKLKIDRTPGMKGVLVRDGDYYIPLRKRMQIARQKHADLFISIHADANPNRHLTGSSVYILSENGASSEAARWLASNENAYESRLGQISLHGKDNTLASMLMDLSQAATIDNSLTLANNTLRELGRVTRLLHRQVESAAFVVLKSPDIPSILVETAFISNPVEERRLNTAEYQNKLANAVYKGVRRFQLVHAPGGRLKVYASNDRRHVVKPGDSLSEIARKYGVSARSLSHHNNLSSSTIRVGQKLYIPTRS